MQSQIVINIPDVQNLFKDPNDLKAFVSTTLSDVITARIQALKAINYELSSAVSKAAMIDDNVALRGVGVTMGGFS